MKDESKKTKKKLDLDSMNLNTLLYELRYIKEGSKKMLENGFYSSKNMNLHIKKLVTMVNEEKKSNIRDEKYIEKLEHELKITTGAWLLRQEVTSKLMERLEEKIIAVFGDDWELLADDEIKSIMMLSNKNRKGKVYIEKHGVET